MIHSGRTQHLNISENQNKSHRHSTAHLCGTEKITWTALVKSTVKNVRPLNKIHIHQNTQGGHILSHKIFNGGNIMQK